MQKRTVLIWIGRIGDFVVSSAFIRQYKQNNPDVFLSVIVSDFVAELAEMIPEIDEIIIFPKKNKAFIFPFVIKMLSSRWDTSINLNPSFSTSAKIVNKFTGAKERIGFKNKRDHKIFTRTAEIPEENEHMLDVYGRLAQTVGFDYERNTSLVISEEDRKEADKIIESLGVNKFIAIHPGNFGKVRSRWPEEKFIELSKYIADNKDIAQVMIAGPGEENEVKAIVDAIDRRNVLMIYNMNLKVTAAFLSKALIFIGNSTGTLHTADALGTPTLSINNHYSFCCWRPLKEKSVALTSGDWRDLTVITPEQVYNGLLELEKKII